jgi:hypothetical protein
MSLTTDPNDPDLKNIRPDGQQQTYLVLGEEERAKGFVCPVRHAYKHLACGSVTTMGQSLAETYARDPKFYGGTFCCHCGSHFRLREFDADRKEWAPAFLWTSDGTPVGSTAEEAEQYLAEQKRREAEKHNGGGI